MGEVSAYIIAAGLAWLIAQMLKFLLNATRGSGPRWKQLYQSGNMPSAHTATVVALTTIIGARDGVDSSVFALALVFTLITAYDAMMARRSAGEQGVALRKLLQKSPFAHDPLPHHALGHKPLEVAAGALLGVTVGIIVAILVTF